jgi:hypothetical protein
MLENTIWIEQAHRLIIVFIPEHSATAIEKYHTLDAAGRCKLTFYATPIGDALDSIAFAALYHILPP